MRAVVVRVHIIRGSTGLVAVLLFEFLCVSRQGRIFSDLSLQRRHASRRGVDSTKNQSSPTLTKNKKQESNPSSKRQKRDSPEPDMEVRNSANGIDVNGQMLYPNGVRYNGELLDAGNTSAAAERLAHTSDNGDISPIFNATLRKSAGGSMRLQRSQTSGRISQDSSNQAIKNGVTDGVKILVSKHSPAAPSPPIRRGSIDVNSSLNRTCTSSCDRVYSNSKINQPLVLGEYLLCDETLNKELKTFKPKRVKNDNENFTQEDRIAVHVIEMVANGHDEENVVPKCLKIDSEMFT